MLNKHHIKHHVPETPTKTNIEHRVELVNNQESDTEPKNIPIILKGCASDKRVNSVFCKNVEVSFPHNSLHESYVKLLNSKNGFPKSSKHRILLIGNSHLRGCSANMKLYLNNQFELSGCMKSETDCKTV